MANFGEMETLWRRRAFQDEELGGTSIDHHPQTDVFRAIAEAQEQWCRGTLALMDTTSDFLTLACSAGGHEFDVDPRILRIDRVKPVGSAVLQRISTVELDLYLPDWETGPTGTPRFFQEDLGLKKLWVYRRPTAATTIQLWAARLPLTSVDTPLPTWTADSELEIPIAYHFDLLDWVTYRLYDHQSRMYETPEAKWAEKSLAALARFQANIDKFNGVAPTPAGQEAKGIKDARA